MTKKQDLQSKINQYTQTIKDCQFAMIKIGVEYPIATRLLSSALQLNRQLLAEARADYERLGFK